VTVTGTTPDKVTTDKHASYLPALEEVFCDDLEHRTSKYLNNGIVTSSLGNPLCAHLAGIRTDFDASRSPAGTYYVANDSHPAFM
jgi:hypothetical protein